MKMYGKVLAFILACMMLASMITACGDTNVKNDASTQNATNEISQSDTTQQEIVKELEGTVTINTVTGPGAKEAWEAVADAYMKLHPKVKVVVDLKPSDGYGEWIKTAFSDPNTTSDIVNVNMAGPAATDKTINFMEYANVKSPYSDGLWTEQFNFEMQGKNLAMNVWDNISLESVQVLWFYNKSIFEKYQLTPPETWNQLTEVCEKLQKAGIQPLAVPGDYASFSTMQMTWLPIIYADQTTRSLVEVYRAKEGDYNFDLDVDGKFKYDPSDPYNDDSWKVNTNFSRALNAIKEGVYRPDSDGMKTVMENLKKVFPVYSGGESFFGTKDALPLFMQGKAAIIVDGAWRIPAFKKDMDKLATGEEIKSGDQKIDGVQKFELGSFNMPSMEGTGIEAKARTIEVAIGYFGAIKKDKSHDDLVVDFLMYLSSKDGYSKYLTAGINNGYAPNGPPLVYGVELPDEYAAMFKDLTFIGNMQKGATYLLARGAPFDIPESTREWYQYTQDYFNGKIDVNLWAQKHKDNVFKYLDQAMKSRGISENDLKNPQNAPTGK